jgi:16S rRNA (uracil1498-N3)-methyltransferase
MDLIVRQAVEAGVGRIVPVASERCVAAEPAAGRLARWRRIAQEALEQSGAGALPALEDPVSLAEAARRFGTPAPDDGAVRLFFHEGSVGACPLHEILAGDARAVTMLIGPEGGLSEGEVETLRGAGFRQGWLGPTVLRVETAALYAAAAVRTIVRERATWKAAAGSTGS